MKRRTSLLLLVAGLILGGVAFLPLRLVLPEGLLAARSVSGSIWNGRIEEAAIGPVRLGTLEVGVRWPGVLRVTQAGGAADALRATLSPAGASAIKASDVSGLVPVQADYGALVVSGVTLRNAALHLGEQGCVAASGRVTASAGLVAMPGAPGLSMGGVLECRGHDLVALLKSQSGQEQAAVTLFPGGRWQVQITVRPLSPEAAQMLESAGFRASPTGHVRMEQGRLGSSAP